MDASSAFVAIALEFFLTFFNASLSLEYTSSAVLLIISSIASFEPIFVPVSIKILIYLNNVNEILDSLGLLEDDLIVE